MNATVTRKGAAMTAERKFGRKPAIELGDTPNLVMVRRIGSCTFKINVYTSPNATETAEQKMFRLIEREVAQQC
jgi:hypothetical protein